MAVTAVWRGDSKGWIRYGDKGLPGCVLRRQRGTRFVRPRQTPAVDGRTDHPLREDGASNEHDEDQGGGMRPRADSHLPVPGGV